MKTPPALAFVVLAIVAMAAAPAPTGLPAQAAPELVQPDLAPADPVGIGNPAPLPRLSPCLEECLAIRRECDAGCSATWCYRECRDSAVQCSSQC